MTTPRPVRTLRSELAALEAALGHERDPEDVTAELAARQRQALAFDPAVLPGPGTPMPDGDLVDIADTPTTLHATRDGRPAVVVFYRGGWCPYCNLTLRTYERDVLPVVRSRGATLIAISADTVDGSLAWHELTYDVLADPHHTIARQLGIMGTPLPLPTTVLVDAAGLIQWFDVHPDHVTRTEPAAIIRALDLIAR